jgi:TDG/mug DNA glycosylase family protein
VFFNGIKAQKVFRRYVLPTLTKDRHTYTLLPSTSPAHAAIPLKAKIQAWSVIVSATDAARN